MPSGRRPLGVTALTGFFALGTLAAAATALAIARPGEWSRAMWQLKPETPAQFAQLGSLAIPLLVAVGAACAGAAVGLWTGRRWGYRIALALLGVDLLGDTVNAAVRGDWRTLVGLPIGGLMLAYLVSGRVRGWFSP